MEVCSGFTFENLICGSNKCYVSSDIKKKEGKEEDMNGGKKQDEKTRWETACPETTDWKYWKGFHCSGAP